ncbi:tRNA (adenosine(37)-N6)-threonylcarbamoyltransferase complex dimerization subunit type 1 TsaB [Candidatus Peregrinibacteria bacterium CG_4_10_14_0_2_um_filter_41_8]|nr:MAG: tRNA (adenosine(37)-N6)-threonylcarbamoyltransferase complex dimerization subunit type 1 TsaB [Candidatus Peregrinibacteria bacterium CG_4_10_14_0_2_um_filter_41_8]
MSKLLINTATEFKEIALLANNKWHAKTWQEQASDLDHILPNIEQLLKETDTTLQDLDEVHVLQGPGSFTSLRLGIAAANTLAQELNIDLKVLNTADYITARLPAPAPNFCLLKSGGQQVHVFKDGEYVEQMPLADFINHHQNDTLTIATDFTDRLDKIWQATEHTLTALAAADWLPLDQAWGQIQKAEKPAEWPVVPEYFKDPGIS